MIRPGRRPIAVVACALLGVALTAPGCTRYQPKAVPILAPAAYPNAASAFGATVGSRAYTDPALARETFGFDIVGAGLLPVQVAFDHTGPDPIEIVPSQTFLVDPSGQLWSILDEAAAYRRLEASTEWGEMVPEAAKGAVLGAAAGAIIGAAVGIVSGENVGEMAGKGAAAGAAGGALVGGTRGLTTGEVRQQIREDLRKQGALENRPIPPQSISHGVLYFPAEAKAAKHLRLQVRNTRTGEIATLTMPL